MKLRTGKMDIVVNTSMTPPHWAMLERQLINAPVSYTHLTLPTSDLV